MKKIWFFISGVGCGFLLSIFSGMKEKIDKSKKNEISPGKFISYYNILNRWMTIKENGKSVEKYFVDREYKQIAIYGIAKLSNHLIADLENSNVKVAYGIDKRAEVLYAEIPILGLDEAWPEVDAIIVTPVYDYDNIKKLIETKVDYPVISLEEVVSGDSYEN